MEIKRDSKIWADEVVLSYIPEEHPKFRAVILRLTHSQMYNGKIVYDGQIIDSVRAHHDGITVAELLHQKLEARIAIQVKKDVSSILK